MKLAYMHNKRRKICGLCKYMRHDTKNCMRVENGTKIINYYKSACEFFEPIICFSCKHLSSFWYTCTKGIKVRKNGCKYYEPVTLPVKEKEV